MGDSNNLDDLQTKLNDLKREHRELDNLITDLSIHSPYDQLQIKRLKKRKLILKDTISLIENNLIPDIIA
jgi:hypothetical protein